MYLMANNKLVSCATNQGRASILSHELDHAVEDVTKPVEIKKLRNTYDKDYDDGEEKRVITGSEQKVARRTGEIRKDQVTRKDHHRGSYFPTSGPTSNVDLSIPQ